MTDESQSTADRSLRTKVRETPAAVSARTFVESAADPAVSANELEEAFREAVQADVVDAADAAATLLEVLTGDRYETQTIVAPLLAVLAAERPAALAGSTADLVAVAAENELVVDDVAASFPALARAEPQAVLAHVDAVVALLESDLVPVRHAAIGTLVVLSEHHPERLTGYAADVVALLARDPPALGESIDGVQTDQPRVPESMHEQLTATNFQIRAVREGAAVVLYDLAAADPGTVVEFVDELAEVVTDSTSPQVRELVLDALELVAVAYPDDVVAVSRTAAVQTAERSDPEDPTRASAARLLATVARTQEAAVADAIREADAVTGLANVLADAESPAETDARRAAADLFAVLARQGLDVGTDAVEALESAVEAADSEAVSERAAAALDEVRD